MAVPLVTDLHQATFRQDLIALLRSSGNPKPWEGLSAIEWARTFDPSLASRLVAAGYIELAVRLNRRQLAEFCGRKDVPIEFRIAAVMAWGRANFRNTGHNRRLWASVPDIAALTERLPGMMRAQAFAEFQQLAASGILRGMRASYFTKLMFFFGCPGAYILDQWLGKSILALSGINWRANEPERVVFSRVSNHFIRLGPGGTSIHERMSGVDYEQFCVALESLVEPLGCRDGADAERWLFSEPRSAWRKFLKTLDWKARPART